mgnify:CR=1 FL=1
MSTEETPNLSQRTCAYCLEAKTWIWNGKRLRDGSKVYNDDKSRRWSGKRCPDCESKRVKQSLKVDGFRRGLIKNNLESLGYKMKLWGDPIIAQKSSCRYKVGLVDAYVDAQGKITISEKKPGYDLYLLMFQTLRVCQPDVVENILGALPSLHDNHP